MVPFNRVQTHTCVPGRHKGIRVKGTQRTMQNMEVTMLQEMKNKKTEGVWTGREIYTPVTTTIKLSSIDN